jgi:Zn-dependent peptidase ImmA (M78 family)
VDPPDEVTDTTARTPVIEEEANTFAAALLMPAPLVRKHYARLRDRGSMCRLFGTSGAAMGRRLYAVI